MNKPVTTSQRESPLSLEQHIARSLKQRRISQGYKNSDVARIAGVSVGMVRKVENAQVSTSLDILNRLCYAIGLPVSKSFIDYDIAKRDAQFINAGESL